MNTVKSFELSWVLDYLRASYWFVPTVLVLLAIAMAIGLIAADRLYGFAADIGPWWLFLSEADSARAILSTIATSMITVVSLAFSITMVVLTLASSQFGPRLLYNFMRDRSNQFALGIFLASFVYCLLVLRSVGTDAKGEFVPHLSTTMAMLLAALSVAVLIHFIHHIADGIQANSVISNVRHELRTIVCRLLPEVREPAALAREEADWRRLTVMTDRGGTQAACREQGILQAVDQDVLVEWARKHDRLIRLRYRPGEFVIEGNPLFDIFPDAPPDPDAMTPAHNAFQFGHRRTLVQDIEFSFQQLVEIALRALSPGINDPFTAMACIEELGAALALIANRASQPRVLYDRDDAPRLLIKRVDFEGVAEIAFNQIRQNSADYPAVLLRMLETIAAVAQRVRNNADRAVLRRHAEAIHALARESVRDPGDRRALDGRFERAALALAAPDPNAGRN